MCQLNEKFSLTFFFLNTFRIADPIRQGHDVISFYFLLYHVKYKNTDLCGALSHHSTGSLICEAVHLVPAKFPRTFPLTSLALVVCLFYWLHLGRPHGVNTCGSECAEWYIFYRGHDTKICLTARWRRSTPEISTLRSLNKGDKELSRGLCQLKEWSFIL